MLEQQKPIIEFSPCCVAELEDTVMNDISTDQILVAVLSGCFKGVLKGIP